jgi:hypothetical protein
MVENAVAGKIERGKGLGVDAGLRFGDLGRAHAHADLAQVDAVIAQGQIDQSCILVAAHAVDDRGDRFIDVGGRFPLGREKRAEAGLEVRRPLLEPQGHGVGEA